MSLIPVYTPKLVKSLFPNLVWDVPTKEKTIYLTFDDGPTPEITEWTLDILKQFDAKATFFCIGKNINANPRIFKKIINYGHAVGNHTLNHLKGWQTKSQSYIDNIKEAQSIIDKYNDANQNAKFFRPPYGQISPVQIKKILALNYKIIMWTVLSIDWDKNVTNEQCLKNVIENTNLGTIVVFHDSIKAWGNMKYVLPKTLEYFSERGYKFKRIPEQVQ